MREVWNFKLFQDHLVISNYPDRYLIFIMFCSVILMFPFGIFREFLVWRLIMPINTSHTTRNLLHNKILPNYPCIKLQLFYFNHPQISCCVVILIFFVIPLVNYKKKQKKNFHKTCLEKLSATFGPSRQILSPYVRRCSKWCMKIFTKKWLVLLSFFFQFFAKNMKEHEGTSSQCVNEDDDSKI